MVNLVTAEDLTLCESVIDRGDTCRMVTPPIVCSVFNYTVINTSSNLTVEENNLTQLNNDIYFFIFNQSSGTFATVLCDDSYREIIVREVSDLGGTALASILAMMVIFTIATIIGFTIVRNITWKIVLGLGMAFLIQADTFFAYLIAVEIGVDSIANILLPFYNIATVGMWLSFYAAIAILFMRVVVLIFDLKKGKKSELGDLGDL